MPSARDMFLQPIGKKYVPDVDKEEQQFAESERERQERRIKFEKGEAEMQRSMEEDNEAHRKFQEMAREHGQERLGTFDFSPKRFHEEQREERLKFMKVIDK